MNPSFSDRFAALLDSHGAALRRVASVHAGRAGEEEDLYQEILLQLWRSLPSFKNDATLKTWVYRVALNTALTWRRSERRARVIATDTPPEYPAPAQIDSYALVSEFLATLGKVDRSILLLYMEGMSHAEIGDVVGLNVGAVAVRVFRLKQSFEDRYVEH